MSTKDRNDRDTSTERLFDTEVRPEKRLKDEEEQTIVGATRNEELSLQNIFIDKGDDVTAQGEAQPEHSGLAQEVEVDLKSDTDSSVVSSRHDILGSEPDAVDTNLSGRERSIDHADAESSHLSTPITNFDNSATLGNPEDYAQDISDRPEAAPESENPVGEQAGGPAINTPPVAGSNVNATVAEDAASISGRLSSFDADQGSTVFFGIAAGATAPAGFTMNTDGFYSFDPADQAYDHLNVGDSQVITIPVTVADDQGATDVSYIQITVTGTNDAPVADANISTSMAEGLGAINGQLMSTDVDDGATASYTILEGTSTPDGFALNADGSYSFDPNDDAYDHLNVGDSQVITIPVTVTDDQGATDTSKIQITITGTNDAPVAGAKISSSVEVGMDAIVGQLTSTDTDDGATASYAISDGSSAPGGFVINTDGSYSFDPSHKDYDHLSFGDSQVITIPVTVTDDQGATDTSQVQITVTAAEDQGTTETPQVQVSVIATNEAPVAGANISSTVEEGASTISGQLTSTDMDDGATASYSISEGTSAPGGFEMSADGSYSFDPSDEAYDHLSVGDSQVITIPVTVTDDQGATDVSQIQITITGTNDAPVAGANISSTVEEGAGAIVGQLTSTDVDGVATASYTITEGSDTPDGFAMNADGSYSFDPSDEAYAQLSVGDSQVITIPVTVTDDQGATDTSQIQITVTGTNDAPVAGADVTSSVGEGASAIAGQLTSTDSDAGASAFYSITEGTSAPDGFEINTDGSYSFDPSDEAYDHLNVGDSQVITIPVTVTDDQGATDTSQIQITVTGTNDSPVAGADVSSAVEEGARAIAGQLTTTDMDDGASASFSITEGTSAPDGFEMSADGSYSFDPSDEAYDHLSVGDSQVITIPVTVTDEQGATDTSQIQFTVTGTNDAPVAGANISSTVEEGASTISGQFTSTDMDDGATASYSITEGTSAPGGFTMNADGSYSFDPSDEAYDHLSVGDSQVITIPVTVTDEQGATDTAQVQIKVTGTNDAPVAGADVSRSVEEGASAISGRLTSTDMDDGASASFSITEGTSAPDGFEMNADGSYSFDPSDEAYDHLSVGDSQIITIPVTVTDDQGAMDTAQIQITVTGTNDAPVAGADVSSAVEEGAGAMSGQLTSTDMDDGASASFTITEGASAPDGFEMSTDGSYSFDPSDEAYDHLNVGDSQVITIPVTVTDDQGATDTSQIQIRVTGTNDAPVAGADVSSAVEEGARAIAGQLTTTDMDDGASASFSITEGTSAPDGFEMKADGSYSFDPSDEAYDHLSVGDSQIITIPVTVTDDQGATDTAQIQINVTGTNDAPVAGADVASSVKEGAGAISGRLTSTDMDDGARASYSITEGSEIPDGFEMQADGSYSFDPSDEAYDHLSVGDSQIITIPVTVTDDQGATDTAQVQIKVTGTNDAPVAGADVSSSVKEGASAISGRLTSTDMDDGARASFSITEGTSAPDGFEMNTDGSYSFDPSDEAYDHLNVGDSQVITIPVTVTDDSGATDTSQIQITVTGTNDAPVADADVSSAVEEGARAISGQLTSTDMDDGASASFTITEGASVPDGFEMSADGSYSFDPSDEAYDHLSVGDSQVITIPVTVTDDQGATDTSQIQITVTGTNDAPVAGADVASSVKEGASAISGRLTSTDMDDGARASFSITEGTSAPDGFEMNTDGSYSFDPSDEAYDHLSVGDSQVITIPVTLTDDQGATDTAQIQIKVTGTNDAPVAGADVASSVKEGASAISGRLTSTDMDDGASASFSITEGSAAPDGFEMNTDGSYSFDPSDEAYDHLSVGDSQVITIPVTVTDEQGATDTAQVQIKVTGTNDAPVAGADVSRSVEEGASAISGRLTSTDMDDGASASFSITEGTSAPDGFEMNADGSYSFDPSDEAYDHLSVGDSQVITIPVTLTDDQGATDTAQIQIKVTGTNDAPVAGADVSNSVEEGASAISGRLTSTDMDDGARASFSITEGTSAPEGFEMKADGSYSFDPSDEAYDHLSVGDSQVITIPVTVTDDQGATDTAQIQIKVVGTNDAPVAGADVASSVKEGASAISGQLTSTDMDDGATASYSITEGSEIPDGFEMQADGSYSFDPSDEAYDHLSVGDSQVITIPVTVADDQGATDTAQIQIKVTGTNDAPVAGADVSSSVKEGASAISGRLTSTDLDDGARASFSITEGTSAPDGFEMNADGSYSFDPSDEAYDHLSVGDSQVITIPVTVTDDQGATDTSQIQITVTGTNDAPVAGADVASSVKEGASAISGRLTSTDMDDGARASFSITEGTSVPDGFEMKADGSYSFDPSDEAYDHLNVGDSQVITIPVTVTDDQGATDTSQIQITVTGTNDAPTAISATGGTVEENVGAGTVAAQLSATDADEGESLSYSLTSESSLFEIQGDQVVVKSGAQLNYEADEEHTLNIQVTDENGASYQQEIQIQISDVNESPTDISLSASAVDEHSAGGTVVATMSASDQDNEESFTYELTDESGLFEISGDQVVVKQGADIDFESDDAHNITVEVTDSAGNTHSENFTIQVNDIVENIGPVAVDDTPSASFTPENATLTAELNFDDGMPSANFGSISAEEDGQVGGAADFSNGQVSVSDLDLDGADGAQTTVSMWIQGDPDGSWEMLAGSDIYDLALYDGNIGFNTGQSDMFGTDASELADGEWHHVVGIFTNGDLSQNEIFIDGVEQEMSQIQGTPYAPYANIDSDNGTLHFGGWGVNEGYRFTGSMDEVKVFDGDLSGDEVSELYAIEAGHDHWENSGQGEVQEDVALVISPEDLLSNDSDADGDTLSIVSVEDAEHGSVEINEEGEIVFTPEEDYHGEASFSYTVSDGNGGTDSATVTLNVTSVDDAPIIDIVDNVSVAEGATTITGQLTSTDGDDGATASFSVSEGSSAPEGFTLSEDGSYSFDPADDAYDHLDVGDSEVLTIPVTVTDDTGATDTSEIQITITGTNEAPIASDETLSVSFTPENATLTAELNFDDGMPRANLGSISAEADGQVGGAADFSNAQVSVNDLDLDSADGAQTTVSMWIQGDSEGDWEMLAGSDTYDMVLVDGDIGFNTGNYDLFGTDASELADGEWHHVVGIFTNGDLTQNEIFIDGVGQEMSQIQGTPYAPYANIDNDDGTLHFGGWGANEGYRFTGSMDEIKVYDGDLSADEVSELYAIEAGHDHWQNSGQGDAHEDVPLVISPEDLLANDIDADGDTLSIVSVENAEHGSVEINEEGEIVFTPEENYHGDASFSYTVSDGNGGTDSATVSLTIDASNDAPVIKPVELEGSAGDSATTFSSKELLANASDVDGDQLVVTDVSVEAEFGTVTDNGDGEWTFNPSEDYSGEDVPLKFTVSDGTDSTSSTATIDGKEAGIKGEDPEDTDLEDNELEDKEFEDKESEDKDEADETEDGKVEDIVKGTDEGLADDEEEPEELSLENELLFSLETRAEDDADQGWAEKVDVEEDAFGAANDNGWGDDASVADDFDLAASALDLAPDTSGVITLTEGGDIDSLSNLQDSANF